MAQLEAEPDDEIIYEKPLLVKVIGILSIVAGILVVVAGILSAGFFTTVIEETGVPMSFPIGSIQMLIFVVLGSGAATALQGWGLLKMKPWGWLMMMFFLLAMIFFSIHGYTSNPAATSAELSMMIVSILIAGLLLAYFGKRKEYFDVSSMSTRTTLLIIGGLVTYSMLSLILTEMAGTSIMEWLSTIVLDESVYSI